MIKINEDRLINDIKTIGNVLVSNPSNDVIRNDYTNFIILNQVLATTYKKIYSISNLFCDRENFSRLLQKYQIKDINDFISFVDNNEEILNQTFKNYLKTLKKCKYIQAPFYSKARRYSEKDFIDVILSYFNTYGDKIYKTAKKYFDEERVHMNYGLFSEGYAGFFTNLVNLQTGYIVSIYNKYTSYSASSVVHELGHAIDSECFVFPQQKNIPIFSDCLIEVPSTTFELGFSDYLVKNKIDEDIGLVMLNDRYAEVQEKALDAIDALKQKDVEIDDEGYAYDQDNNKYNLRDDILYGLGYYIAMHFNLIRNDNLNEFNKVFNNFITSRKEATLEELISKMGISIEDFTNSRLIKPKIKEDTLKLKKRYNLY